MLWRGIRQVDMVDEIKQIRWSQMGERPEVLEGVVVGLVELVQVEEEEVAHVILEL